MAEDLPESTLRKDGQICIEGTDLKQNPPALEMRKPVMTEGERLALPQASEGNLQQEIVVSVNDSGRCPGQARYSVAGSDISSSRGLLTKYRRVLQNNVLEHGRTHVVDSQSTSHLQCPALNARVRELPKEEVGQ